MKRLCHRYYFLGLILLLSFGTADVYCQADTLRNNAELSISETLGGKISGSPSHGNDAFSALMLSADLYLIGGFSVGPEFGIFVDGTISPLLTMNAAYTHWQAGGKRGMYVRLGFGTIIYPGNNFTDTPNKIFTGGIGIKFLNGRRSLFRVELNYKLQWWKEKMPVYIMPADFGFGVDSPGDGTFHSQHAIGILIGYSFLF
jgi:hypothetical protein